MAPKSPTRSGNNRSHLRAGQPAELPPLLDQLPDRRPPDAPDPESITTKAYKVRVGTHQRVQAVAAHHDVGIGELVDWAIAVALDDLERGERTLPVRRVQVEVAMVDRGRVGRPSMRRIVRGLREQDDGTA
jgi:hypothetical protein